MMLSWGYHTSGEVPWRTNLGTHPSGHWGYPHRKTHQRACSCRNIDGRGHLHRRAHQRDSICTGTYRGGNPTEEPIEEPATPMAMASGLTEEPDVPLVTCEGKEKGGCLVAAFLAEQRSGIPLRLWPPLGKPPDSQWVEAAIPQPECRRKEGLALQSWGMQVGHAGGRWFITITRVPRACTSGCPAPRLQRGCDLPAKGFSLPGSHWGSFRAKAARYVHRIHGGNSVHHPNNPGWGHWGHIPGHSNCFGGERSPREPL